jgi:hypothetical protein
VATIQRRGPEDYDPQPVTTLVERGLMSQETYEGMPEADRTAMVYIHHPGSATEPQLVELTLKPDLQVLPHAHNADEIIVVKEGSMKLGALDCPAGTSILIPKDTLYGFRVGPEGVTFLNFRPTGDYAHISKEEFLAKRKGSAPAEDASAPA